MTPWMIFLPGSGEKPHLLMGILVSCTKQSSAQRSADHMHNRNEATHPLISCIIPTKNRHDLALRAIQSVLDQSYKNIEIIVIDDNSKPSFTTPIREEYNRVKIIRSNISLGGARARNLGIVNANGEYLCFLDDDDTYLPNKLEIMARILVSNPHIGVVGGDILINDIASGNITSTTHKFSIVANTRHNRIHTNSTLIRKSSLGAIRFNENLEKFQDTQFNTEIFFKIKSIYIPTPVAVWNTNGSRPQITTRKGLFFNTINYFLLVKHLLLEAKVPLRLMSFHLYKLTSFLVRGK